MKRLILGIGACVCCFSALFGCKALQSDLKADGLEFLPAQKIEAAKIEIEPDKNPESRPPKVVPVAAKKVLIEPFVPESKDKRNVAKRIDATNEKAKQGPDNFINAITVYDYMPGALYQIYTSDKHITDIMLQPGEALTSPPAAGDTLRWFVADTVTGSGAQKRVHVFIKPRKPGLATNVIIPTTRHIYHLEVKSFQNTYQAAVSWHYPKEQFATFAQRRTGTEENSQIEIAEVNLENLNFDYRIEGEARWKPVRVFNDGEKTFIKFPDSVAQREIPPLFIVTKGKKPQIVNYRFRNNFYVVDRLFDAAMLAIGEKDQEKVYIYTEDFYGSRNKRFGG